MKALVIPDVHLKPWMFDKASALMMVENYDIAVMLGDLVDDWDQEANLELYNRSFDAAIRFCKKFSNTLWCYGNHDVSYLWKTTESGYSFMARETVVSRIDELKKTLPPENTGFVFNIDNVLFSHAGMTYEFISRIFPNASELSLNDLISKINRMGKNELWQDDSPIWARPQSLMMKLYPHDMLQVVGHTPVIQPTLQWNLLTLDTFSTYRDGTPIGTEQFVWIDTVTQKAYELSTV